MKVFVILVACTGVIVNAGDTGPITQQIRQECMTENGIDAVNEEADNMDDIKCYYACIDKQIGIMKDDGSYDIDAIMNKFAKSKTREEVERKFEKIKKSCEDKVGKDDYCKLSTCLHKVPRISQWRQ